MSNLAQIFMHSEISGFQLSLNLAYHQPWIREYLHYFSTHFLNHDIPTNKALYSFSLFVAEKPNLKGFWIVILLGDIKANPTLDPLWFAAPSTYTFQDKGSCKEIVPTDFSSIFYFSTISFNRVSANSATRSARTWPLTEVRGMYLISKAPKIVSHLEIFPV